MTSSSAKLRPIEKDLTSLDGLDWDFRAAPTNGLTHGIHPYPAKFIPQIPRALISSLSSPGDTIADIFSGSGTTLVEALVLGRHAIGLDANPLACLISEAKTTQLGEQDHRLLMTLATRARELANELAVLPLPLFTVAPPFRSSAPRPDDDALAFWFEPFVIEELAEILSWCRSLPAPSARLLALAAFSSIVVVVSRQDSDTRYVRREKYLKPGDALRRFARAVDNVCTAAFEFNSRLPANVTAEVHCVNVLGNPGVRQFDLMVCSPPYPNAYSYHLYHMTRMLWLGMDQPKFKREEIGSHRKYSSRSPSRATAETFKREMATVMNWLAGRLNSSGFACFVIGNSTIGGEVVDNAEILSEVAFPAGLAEVRRFRRRLHSAKKAFNPVIGKIKTETILVFQKTEV